MDRVISIMRCWIGSMSGISATVHCTVKAKEHTPMANIMLAISWMAYPGVRVSFMHLTELS